MFGSSVLALAQAPVNVHVGGEKGWVTAIIAVGAALLGSFSGATASFYWSILLDRRRRRELSEIRRKAKVYTPIREEIVALRSAIADDQHIGYSGILRERPHHQGWQPGPLLVIWHELVENGVANTSAGPSVRAVLKRVEERADEFNATLAFTRDTFKERGDRVVEQSGSKPSPPNWASGEFETLLRHGIGAIRAYQTAHLGTYRR